MHATTARSARRGLLTQRDSLSMWPRQLLKGLQATGLPPGSKAITYSHSTPSQRVVSYTDIWEGEGEREIGK